MKKYLIIAVIFGFYTIGIAQNKLSTESSFWTGTTVYNNGNKITVNEAKEIIKNNTTALEKISKAQSNRTIGAVLAYPGSFAFGWNLGAGKNANWTVGGIGGVIMIVGSIIGANGDKQLKESVEQYNNDLNNQKTTFKPEL